MKTINYIGILMGLILISVSSASASLYDDFTGNNGDPLDDTKWSTSRTTISDNRANVQSSYSGDTGYPAYMESLTEFTSGASFKYRWSCTDMGNDLFIEQTQFGIYNTHEHDDDGYYVYARNLTSFQDTYYTYIKLYKVIDGSGTLIDEAINPFAMDTDYDVSWYVYADKITFKVDGETILESTDTIPSFSGGYFRVYNSPYNSNGRSYQNYIDDVYAFGLTYNSVTITLNDNCANLLNNATTVIYNKDDSMNVVYEGEDNPITIPEYYDIHENDELSVIWSTWRSLVYKNCIAQFDHDINLFDPFVYWIMNVRVYDNETNPIEDANVDFNQDCTIFGYATRNKYTDGAGFTYFTQCENKDAILTVGKDGYQTLTETISGGWYDATINTYAISVILQPSEDSGNNSNATVYNGTINDTNATEIPEDIPDDIFDGLPNDVTIYFRDTNGAYTTQINDTDPYVWCYYSVKSPDPLVMTLRFEESPNGYDWFTAHTYPYDIDNNSYGYMNISNSYFNDSTLMYRSYIRDAAYPSNDRYAYLNVVNVTNESETHYENLTGYCMIMNTQANGTIDYREDITCYAYVFADTDALKTVSMELYDETDLIESKNLDWMDFIDDDIYGWYLGYNYTMNHNYSLVLKASDGSILDTDNVLALNTVGNKLTVKVTDTSGHDLNHAYVFVEHYGSINTGYLNYGAFEGLPNGESRYKASKTGYRTGAWGTINLMDENKVVTYQLIKEIQEGSMSQARMSDDDVKNLYYPFMYFLGIVILLGALINVIKQ